MNMPDSCLGRNDVLRFHNGYYLLYNLILSRLFSVLFMGTECKKADLLNEVLGIPFLKNH